MGLMNWWNGKSRGRRSRQATARRPFRLEALEDRRVPAILFDPGSGGLALVGTLGADDIRIDQSGADTLVKVNKESATFTSWQVKEINVYGSSGDDFIGVYASSGFPIYVMAETGNDKIYISLAKVQGYLWVSGGDYDAYYGYSNRLEVVDYGNAAATNYLLSSGSLTRWGDGVHDIVIQYADIDRTIVWGGDGANDYSVEGVLPGSELLLRGGDGADTFKVTPSAKNLDKLASGTGIDIFGGAGTDYVVVHDEANSQGTTYSSRMEHDEVFRRFKGSSTVEITLPDVEELSVLGGSGANTWKIDTPSIEKYLTGGAGADSFAVAGEGRYLHPGYLSIAGGGGYDAVDVFDSANIVPTTYSVSSSLLTKRDNSRVVA
jgi:hypothetical protein